MRAENERGHGTEVRGHERKGSCGRRKRNGETDLYISCGSALCEASDLDDVAPGAGTLDRKAALVAESVAEDVESHAFACQASTDVNKVWSRKAL